MKKIVARYQINRSWGDGRCVALFHAVRGKVFPYLLTQQIIDSASESMMGAEETAKFINEIMGETK